MASGHTAWPRRWYSINEASCWRGLCTLVITTTNGQAEQFATGHSLIYIYADPTVTRLVYWTRVIGLTHPIVTLRMPISSFWIGRTPLYKTENIYHVAPPANSSSSVWCWFTKHLISYSSYVQIFSAAAPSASFLRLFSPCSPSTWNAS